LAIEPRRIVRQCEACLDATCPILLQRRRRQRRCRRRLKSGLILRSCLSPYGIANRIVRARTHGRIKPRRTAGCLHLSGDVVSDDVSYLRCVQINSTGQIDDRAAGRGRRGARRVRAPNTDVVFDPSGNRIERGDGGRPGDDGQEVTGTAFSPQHPRLESRQALLAQLSQLGEKSEQYQRRHSGSFHYTALAGRRAMFSGAVIRGGFCGGRSSLSRRARSFWSAVSSV
jgi:hypothetical protein